MFAMLFSACVKMYTAIAGTIVSDAINSVTKPARSSGVLAGYPYVEM